MTTLSTASVSREGNGDWSDLPEVLLHTILTCLCSLVDFSSFKSVCRSWRAVASSLRPSVITSRFPPLLLSPAPSDGFRISDPTSPSFFSFLPFDSDKFEDLDTRCYSHGHVLTLSGNCVVITNLFTGGEFYSPTLPDDLDRMHIDLKRYVLTAPLSSSLLVSTTHPLFYWHIGSDSWFFHFPKFKITDDLRIVTVQGKVYAMNPQDYSLYVLDVSPELHLRPLKVEGIQQDGSVLEHFLVDCGGELLHIQLIENEDELVENEDELEENEDELEENEEESRPQLEVFMLDLSVNRPRWVKKETLGNWAIFVGCNRRVPGIAVENPERWGGRSNCVYFVTNNANGDSPWAAIKLGDRINIWDQELPLYIRNFGYELSFAWVHPGF